MTEQGFEICFNVSPFLLLVKNMDPSSSTFRLSIAALHIFEEPRHEQRSKRRLTTPHDDAAPEDTNIDMSIASP